MADQNQLTQRKQLSSENVENPKISIQNEVRKYMFLAPTQKKVWLRASISIDMYIFLIYYAFTWLYYHKNGNIRMYMYM